MRWLGKIVALLAVAAALAVIVARWSGQRATRVFPLPAPDGCWQTLCLAGVAFDEWPALLDAHPDVQPGSARLTDDGDFDGYAQAVEFVYAPDGVRAWPVLLYPEGEGYTLARDWRRAAALMNLGDLVATVGPPAGLHLEGYSVVLEYPARRLEAIAYPSESDGRSYAQIAPQDHVVFLRVLPAGGPGLTDALYSSPSQPWQGFTLYRFAD